MSSFELLRILLEAAITGQMGLFAIYLVSTGDMRPARLALAGIAGIFAVVSIINAVTSAELGLWLRPVNLVLELSMGPTIYVFVQQMRNEPPILTWRSLGHLFPLIVGPILLALRNAAPVDAIVIAIHMAYLMAIGLSLIGQKQHYQQDSLFRFLLLFAGFFSVLVFFRVSLSIESGYGRDFRISASYIAILIGMASLSAAIIITALRHPQIFSASQAFTKYAGSSATESEIDLILERLETLFREEELFRNPEVTVADLAARVKAPAKHVSQAVNARRGMSVPALINLKRVDSVAHSLTENTGGDATITDIMLKAGFGSKSAFQREFQKRYGMSPSEYRRQNGAVAKPQGAGD